MIDFGEESSIDNFFLDEEDLKVGGLLGFLTGEIHCPICSEEDEIQWHWGTGFYYCPYCDLDFEE